MTDREATDAEVEEAMSDGDKAVDTLIEIYRRLSDGDRAAGVLSDEPALGGVGMALAELGPDAIVIVASMAIRRLAVGTPRRQAVSDAR